MNSSNGNITIFWLLVLLLLIILGVVSFHYYAFVSAKNNLSVGAGVGLTIFPDNERR